MTTIMDDDDEIKPGNGFLTIFLKEAKSLPPRSSGMNFKYIFSREKVLSTLT